MSSRMKKPRKPRDMNAYSLRFRPVHDRIMIDWTNEYGDTTVARFKLKELRMLIPYLQRCKDYLDAKEKGE